MWTLSTLFGRPADTPRRRPVVEVEKPAPGPRRPLKMLMDMRPAWQRDLSRGPGPSRMVYRIYRAWAQAWLRRTVRLAVPIVLGLAVLAKTATEPRVHAWVGAQWTAAVAHLSARPEFAVTGLAVTGASPDLERLVRERVSLTPVTTSLGIDVAAVRARIEALGPVARARVLLDPQGVLRVSVIERLAAALWRDGGDRLWIVDDAGVRIAPAATRVGYPDLPLLLGTGAPDAAGEALELFHHAHDITPRLRAMVRVGARRWDLVLDRDLVIMLPEREPALALAHVLALHYGEEILNKDLVAVDMRVPARPTLRLTARGLETYRLLDAASGSPGEET